MPYLLSQYTAHSSKTTIQKTICNIIKRHQDNHSVLNRHYIDFNRDVSGSKRLELDKYLLLIMVIDTLWQSPIP